MKKGCGPSWLGLQLAESNGMLNVGVHNPRLRDVARVPVQIRQGQGWEVLMLEGQCEDVGPLQDLVWALRGLWKKPTVEDLDAAAGTSSRAPCPRPIQEGGPLLIASSAWVTNWRDSL